MSHLEKLDTYAVVSIATARAVLGGDGGPVSDDTVYRLIRAGCLDKRGKGKVTTASLKAYLAGERQAAPAVVARQVAPKQQRPAAAPSATPGHIRLVPRLPQGRRRAG